MQYISVPDLRFSGPMVPSLCTWTEATRGHPPASGRAQPCSPITTCSAKPSCRLALGSTPRATSPGGDGRRLRGEDSGTWCVPASHLVLTIWCPDVPASRQRLCGAPPLVGCQSHPPSQSQLGREGNSSRADAITLESGPGMTFSPAAMGCGSVTHFPTPLGCRSPCAKRWLLCR